VELLGISDVTESDLIERVALLNQQLLVFPFFSSSLILLARIAITPLTAYSASLTQGLI